MSQAEQLSDEGPPPLREYLAVLRVRRWSLISVTALALGTSLLLSFRKTPVYQSEAKVLVKPLAATATTTGPGAPPNLETEREIVASSAVADIVANNLRLMGEPEQLLQRVAVEVAASTEILLIRYSDHDPLEAQRYAQAFAEGYLKYRRDQALDDLLAASSAVQERMDALSEQLQETNEDLARTQTPSERANLEVQSTSLVSQIALLQQKLSELTPPETLRVGQVVQPAELPSSPTSPNYAQDAALALVVGLALGVGLAFLRERLDDRLRGRGDLEARAGAPVLAVVPHASSWKKRKEARLVTVTEPRSAPSEAYRTLRTSLLFTASQKGVRKVVITSSQDEEGKTTTVANLGMVLAQAGKRVVLVDADLRKPRLHRFFGVENRVGLTNVLAEEVQPPEAVVQSGVPNLVLLPCGPVPGNPAELLSSDAMGAMLQHLGKIADFVVVDSAPVLAAADASILATYADAVLMVADADRATRGSVAHARVQLDQVNANVVGAVLNNFDLSKARAYPYYYQYYYVYRYEQPDGGRRTRGAERAEPGSPEQRRMWSS